MSMKTSLKGKIALVVSEGVVDTPYLDSKNVWTVGVGVTKAAGDIDPAANKGRTFSMKEIMDMFTKVLVKYEDAVNNAVKVPLKQHEFDALVHFVYNIGEGGFRRSKLLSNLNAGKKNTAFQTGFHGWLKPPELKGRRDKERAMALTGQYGGSIAPLYGVNRNFKPVAKGNVDVERALNIGNTPAPTPQPKPTTPAPVEKQNWFTMLLKFVGDLLSGLSKRKKTK